MHDVSHPVSWPSTNPSPTSSSSPLLLILPLPLTNSYLSIQIKTTDKVSICGKRKKEARGKKFVMPELRVSMKTRMMIIIVISVRNFIHNIGPGR